MATPNPETERRLRDRLEEVQARIAELAKAPEPGSGIGFGKRIGDGTSEAISRRNDIGVGNSLVVTEEKLERALAKLEEGSYGRCDSCGGPIARPARRGSRERALHRVRGPGGVALMEVTDFFGVITNVGTLLVVRRYQSGSESVRAS